MGKTLASILAAGFLAAGCSKSNPGEIQVDRGYGSRYPITQVSRYTENPSPVEIRTNFDESIGFSDLEAFNCHILPGSNGASLVIFDKELMDFRNGWGGVVYRVIDKDFDWGAKLLKMRVFSSGIEYLRVEAQGEKDRLGMTYRDKFRLRTNEVNDINVNISGLVPGQYNKTIQLKLIAEPSYMKDRTGELIIYDAGIIKPK